MNYKTYFIAGKKNNRMKKIITSKKILKINSKILYVIKLIIHQMIEETLLIII